METAILELEVPVQLDLAMVGKSDHIVAVLYHRDHSVGGFPRSAHSVLLRFRRSRSHEAPSNAESGLATSNNEVSSDEQSTIAPELLLSKNLHVSATHLLRLVTPPPLAVQLQVLLKEQKEPSFHQTTITTATNSTFAPSEVSHQLSNGWISQYT